MLMMDSINIIVCAKSLVEPTTFIDWFMQLAIRTDISFSAVNFTSFVIREFLTLIQPHKIDEFNSPEVSRRYGRLLIVVLSWHFSKACINQSSHNIFLVNKSWEKQCNYAFFNCRDSLFTFHISSSEYRPRGSKFFRMLPLKRVGSWGMMLSFILKSFSPIEHILIPSIRMSPLVGSTMRNKALISVVFPLPVLPTTPTLLPSWNVQEMPFRTNGEFGRYLIWNHFIYLKSFVKNVDKLRLKKGQSWFMEVHIWLLCYL